MDMEHFDIPRAFS